MNRKKIIKLITLMISGIVLINGNFVCYAKTEMNNNTDFQKETLMANLDSSSGLFGDISNHWAESAINRAYNDGILKGFDDGTVRPDDKITLSQMITIISRILNLKEAADVSVYGLDENCWYKEALAKFIPLGIIDTEKISTIDGKINRKDAFTMISDAFQLSDANPDMNSSSKYSDFKSLSYIDKIKIASLVNNQYINGWNGSLQLNVDISRAEFVTLLYRIFGQYFDCDSSNNYSLISTAAVISGSSFELSNMMIDHNIWLTAGINNISINNSTLNRCCLRSDSIENLKINNSKINRLIIAARRGDIDLFCKGINVTQIGDGSGTVKLSPAGNSIEVTGNGRDVMLNGKTSSIVVSGDNNNISLSSLTYSDDIKITGKGNKITIDSNVNKLILAGENNIISGSGGIYNLTNNSSTSSVNINAETVIDNTNLSGKEVGAMIEVPESVIIGNYLTANLKIQGVSEGKNLEITWYKDGNQVYSQNTVSNKDDKISFSYFIDYSFDIPDTTKISCKIDYVSNGGEIKSIEVPSISIKIDKGISYILSKISSEYKGNNTAQWAIDNKISDEDKISFVNGMEYSSSSKYLIWINVGTQNATVFEGEKGKWKILKSCLVSTGANNSTPKGVYSVTVKQSNITTDSYTVRPVVKFNGDIALHSKLYIPGTVELIKENNEIGYPVGNGSVRMEDADIQWIYDNVPVGTTIVIY